MEEKKESTNIPSVQNNSDCAEKEEDHTEKPKDVFENFMDARDVRNIAMKTKEKFFVLYFGKVMDEIRKKAENGETTLKLRINKNDVPQDMFVSKLKEKGYKISSYPKSAYDNAPADISALFSFIFSPDGGEKTNYEDFQHITDTYVLHISW